MPSAFMRRLRPEIYSDTSGHTDYELDAATFDHHLETLTRRNQTQDFETFCRKLCERTICPNLRGQTGPDGGGDSKADAESIPVADELSDVFFEGEANSGRERWGFAFSAKEQWNAKIRADVDGLVKTGRAYDRIICVTSRYIKSKARAALEDELTKATGISVTIHDRSWIIDQIVEHGHKDLAFNYLAVGREIDDVSRLGPTDYSRLQQLDEIERGLAQAASGLGLGRDHVLDALVAAKLSRGMEKPRIETDGRFDRAIRLADKHGNLHQRIEARYERIWTAVWWHDDFDFLNNEYDAIERLAADAGHARTVSFLVSLAQLLFTAVIHRHKAADEIRLDQRVDRIVALLTPLAQDGERPNNQIEAEAALLHLDLNRAATVRDRGALSRVWTGYADIIDRARGLAEFDANNIVKLVEAVGTVGGNDPAYSKLVDRLAAFVTERTGEAQGALILLRRAKALDLDQHFEMIRLLSKAVRQLTQKEHSEDLADALCHLAIAYRSSGLPWAARATCMFGLSTMVIDTEAGERLPLRFGVLLKVWIGVSLDLRHLPDFVEALPLLRGVVHRLPYTDEAKAEFKSQIEEFEVVAAGRILNLPDAALDRLSVWPDILERHEIFLVRSALLYALGYEGVLRADGSLPETEPAEDVSGIFGVMRSQPIMAEGCEYPPILNDRSSPQHFVSRILGMLVEVHAPASDHGIIVAEMLLSSLEAFLATALDLRIMPHTERIEITIVEDADVAEPHFTIDRDRMTGLLRWPASLAPTRFSEQDVIRGLWPMIGASLLDATCIVPDADKTLTALTRTERALDRMTFATIAPNSYHRIFSRYLTRPEDLVEGVPRPYARLVRPDIPWVDVAGIVAEQSGQSREEVLRREPRGDSHQDHAIRSVIDLHLWDAAHWRGAGFFGNRPGFPPFFALLFEDEAAAAGIFERWRERFGVYDEEERIRLSVIRRIPDLDPSHYSLQISANPDHAELESGRVIGFTARSLVAEALSDQNLEGFLAMYRRFGAYYLVPAVWCDGMDEPRLLQHLPILKRALNVLEADEITDQDIERIAIKQARDRAA